MVDKPDFKDFAKQFTDAARGNTQSLDDIRTRALAVLAVKDRDGFIEAFTGSIESMGDSTMHAIVGAMLHKSEDVDEIKLLMRLACRCNSLVKLFALLKTIGLLDALEPSDHDIQDIYEACVVAVKERKREEK